MNFFKKLFTRELINRNVTWFDITKIATRQWHNEPKGIRIYGYRVSMDIINVITNMPKGSILDLHKHSDAYEVIHVTSGSIKVNNNRIYTVGDKINLSKDYLHEIEAIEKTQLSVMFYKRKEHGK